MRLSVLYLAVFGIAIPALLALYSCGGNSENTGGDGGAGDGARGEGGGGDSGLHLGDGAIHLGDGGPSDGGTTVMFKDAGFTAPDCPGCTFPPMTAPACSPSTPAIHVVYPVDGVLVPPNMNVISVQWTPFGTPFLEFEVDFENSVPDMRVITKCAVQTVDTEQPPVASGGCELLLDPTMWKFVSDQNRGADPVTVTVRGTTDGKCANKSADKVNLSFSQDDMLGAIYYWKSTVTAAGTGGQVWVKSFGDTSPEMVVTGKGALGASCNGCHARSRDGVRMSA